MKEHRYSKKMAKLKLKADQCKAKAEFLEQRNKHKKAGKFIGEAKHFAVEIERICDKMALLSSKLREKEGFFRATGKSYKADKLTARISYIEKKIAEYRKPMHPSDSNGTREIHTEKQIIKEIVRVPCKYCGAYVDHTETKCPGCGGNLKF